MLKTEDLFTPKDVARIRSILHKEQQGICALTKAPLTKPVVDHKHDSEQFVRGVINSAANVFLGKIENLEARYLNFWYNDGLPNALRLCADYLEKEPNSKYRHLGWIKKVKTYFNALKEPQKDVVLASLGVSTGTNGKERKEAFNKAVLSKQFSYDQIREVIKSAK